MTLLPAAASEVARLTAVVVLPSEGEEPVTRITRAASPWFRVCTARVPAERSVGLGGGGGEGKGIDRVVGLLHLLRNPGEDRQAIKAPELLLAAKARVEHLDRERGGDAEDDAGEEATDDAQDGLRGDRGARAASPR